MDRLESVKGWICLECGYVEYIAVCPKKGEIIRMPRDCEGCIFFEIKNSAWFCNYEEGGG
jgi:hypothetical protein